VGEGVIVGVGVLVGVAEGTGVSVDVGSFVGVGSTDSASEQADITAIKTKKIKSRWFNLYMDPPLRTISLLSGQMRKDHSPQTVSLPIFHWIEIKLNSSTLTRVAYQPKPGEFILAYRERSALVHPA